MPPAGYFTRVRQRCTERGITLILDEIQTGLGRTGKLLAEEHEGIEADVTLIGKALSGGFYPVSAVLSNADVLGVFQPGQHGSTFGGNPLACAVARAALQVLTDEGMIENAAAVGAYILERLRTLPGPVREVRGRGLMLAVELEPDAGGARRFSERLPARGMLVKDTHGHTLRLSPPLIVTREQNPPEPAHVQNTATLPTQITLIGAPTDIGAGARGAALGPEALRVADLGPTIEAQGFQVTDRGNLYGPANPWLPPVDGYRHLEEVAAWNRAVHDAVYAELAEGPPWRATAAKRARSCECCGSTPMPISIPTR
ncbi:hypothetical protein G6F31_014557 [Rhizopus arrhizus]|nr:hypothetical protein G6F31_014557 [Rhizopus arrhizus]